jgi:hypothetical protein
MSFKPIEWGRFFLIMVIGFNSPWLIYAFIMLVIVFLVKPGLKIKLISHKNPTIVRFELSDSGRKE